MILPTILELSIVGVFDAGIPNKERILLRPTETVNLGGFGLHVGKILPNNMVLPHLDNFLWFGDLIVQPPCWIFIYTGPGQYQQTIIPTSGQLAYTFHWGKKLTVFNDPQIVPVLFRFSGIGIGQPQPYPTFPQLKDKIY